MSKLTKKQIEVLEQAFDAEIGSALGERLYPIIQTKSKEAKALADQGYLEQASFTYKGLKITGYTITLAGHATYCSMCGSF